MSEDELTPTNEHLMDPYVLQLIEALSGQQDEVDDLIVEHGRLQLVAGRYQYMWEQAERCINSLEIQEKRVWEGMSALDNRCFVTKIVHQYRTDIAKVATSKEEEL